MCLKCRIVATIPWFGFTSGLGATMILSTFMMLGFSAALAGKGPTVDKEPGLAKASTSSGQQWRGALAAGDLKLSTGEYYDTYDFEGRKGQTVQIRMTSSALDPYLGLHFGDKSLLENDDAATGEGALITTTLEQDGTYTVYATSYKAGEVGEYTLEVGGFGAAGSSGLPVASSSMDTIGPDLEAALQAWSDGFKAHKRAAHTPELTYTEYDTDLRMNGAARVKVVEHRSFGISGQTTLTAEYGSFADESVGLAAYRALVARVQDSSTPCCSFVATESDADVLHSTAWIPFDIAGRMGPLKQAMIEVQLMKLPKLNGTELTWQWDLDLTILHTP